MKAPSDPSDWKCQEHRYCKQWITFDEVDNLTIRGSGTMDGQGSTWWERHSSCKDHKHRDRRVSLINSLYKYIFLLLITSYIGSQIVNFTN